MIYKTLRILVLSVTGLALIMSCLFLRLPQAAPRYIDLGMNGVPVLDQGPFGSCVTFAVTAAIDAELKKGDYTSQLCLLQLGNYFEKNAYAFSGWNGSYARLILARIQTFGIITKEDQEKFGCGGIKNYEDNVPGVTDYDMSIIEYKKHSKNILPEEPANKDLIWFSLSDNSKSRDELLDDVKKSLLNDNRVLFGVSLVAVTKGTAGAQGSYKAQDDTWVLSETPFIDSLSQGGHEMVIIGYDDDAIIKTPDGKKHKGLLKIRNSWGLLVGDKGNFYMAYDYFKMFVIDAVVVSKQQ